MAATVVGSGAYRKAKIVGNNVKKTALHARKKNYFGFRVSYPMRPYVLLKFGIRDFNVVDFQNFKRFFGNPPADLKESFAKVLGIERRHGVVVLKQELIRDFDGNPSKNLEQAGKISDPKFWKRFREIVNFLAEKNIPFLDLAKKNILVKRKSQNTAVPVLFDYKRMDAKYYPFQPWLLTKNGRKNRLLRRAKKLEKEFRAD